MMPFARISVTHYAAWLWQSAKALAYEPTERVLRKYFIDAKSVKLKRIDVVASAEYRLAIVHRTAWASECANPLKV